MESSDVVGDGGNPEDDEASAEEDHDDDEDEDVEEDEVGDPAPSFFVFDPKDRDETNGSAISFTPSFPSKLSKRENFSSLSLVPEEDTEEERCGLTVGALSREVLSSSSVSWAFCVP